MKKNTYQQIILSIKLLIVKMGNTEIYICIIVYHSEKNQ